MHGLAYGPSEAWPCESPRRRRPEILSPASLAPSECPPYTCAPFCFRRRALRWGVRSIPSGATPSKGAPRTTRVAGPCGEASRRLRLSKKATRPFQRQRGPFKATRKHEATKKEFEARSPRAPPSGRTSEDREASGSGFIGGTQDSSTVLDVPEGLWRFLDDSETSRAIREIGSAVRHGAKNGGPAARASTSPTRNDGFEDQEEDRRQEKVDGEEIHGKEVDRQETAAKKSTAKKAATKKKSTAKKPAAKKSTTKKTATKKSTAKKAAAKKSTTKKAAATKSTAKKAPAKTSTAKKTATKKSTAKKAPAKTSTTKKAAATKSTAKKAPAKTSTANKTAAKKPAVVKPSAAKKSPAKKSPAKKAASTPAASAANEEAAPPPPPKRTRKLPASQLERIRKALVDKKYQLSQHLETELSELKSPDRTRSGDLEEIAGDTDGTDSLCEIMDVEAEQIGQIDTALKKIADGTYGICEDCDEEIAPARLEALPFASQCIDCKRKAELADDFYSASTRAFY